MDNDMYVQQDEAETEKDRKRKLVRDTFYNNKTIQPVNKSATTNWQIIKNK